MMASLSAQSRYTRPGVPGGTRKQTCRRWPARPARCARTRSLQAHEVGSRRGRHLAHESTVDRHRLCLLPGQELDVFERDGALGRAGLFVLIVAQQVALDAEEPASRRTVDLSAVRTVAARRPSQCTTNQRMAAVAGKHGSKHHRGPTSTPTHLFCHDVWFGLLFRSHPQRAPSPDMAAAGSGSTPLPPSQQRRKAALAVTHLASQR